MAGRAEWEARRQDRSEDRGFARRSPADGREVSGVPERSTSSDSRSTAAPREPGVPVEAGNRCEAGSIAPSSASRSNRAKVEPRRRTHNDPYEAARWLGGGAWTDARFGRSGERLRIFQSGERIVARASPRDRRKRPFITLPKTQRFGLADAKAGIGRAAGYRLAARDRPRRISRGGPRRPRHGNVVRGPSSPWHRLPAPVPPGFFTATTVHE